MKRIILWVDIKDKDVEQVCDTLKKLLNSVGALHKIVGIYELKMSSETNK